MDADRWRRVEAMCAQALARAPGERRAYLDDACGGDSELRHEVESLMAQESGARSFLEAPAVAPALSSGARLGPYEITAFLGAGGMGEVYKARDTRLGRAVAVKVLPPGFAADAERRRRFEHEARAASALNHPRICTLHDIGEAELPSPEHRVPSTVRVSYLVMELLEGQTLAERLRKGPLPLDQTLEYGGQIADALSRAHREGIVHRDLKPANIMLTRSGAKLLDFGLAKLRGHGEQPAAARLASTHAQSEPLTAEGAILGTLQYMAPEQVEGRDADARADLWALGAILYEMITGKVAFEGSSAAALVGAILERDAPRLAAAHPLTPPGLDRVVRRCLAKDPDARWQSAVDVADELRWLAAGSGVSTGAGPGGAKAARGRTWLRAAALGGVLLVGSFGGLMLSRAWPGAPAGLSRPAHVTIPLDGFAIVTVGCFGHLAISPDGRTIAFRSGRHLALRPLDSDAPTSVDGSTNGAFPAFRPDSRALAFYAGGHIRRVATSGGPAADVAAVTTPAGLAWGDDDRLYFGAASGSEGIWRVPAAGGAPEPVAYLDDAAGENALTFPQPLPGGRAVLFTVLGPSGGSEDSRVAVQIVGRHDHTTVVERATFGRYLKTGHLIFARSDGTILAMPFDLARLKPAGEAVPVLAGVGIGTWGGQAFVDVSNDGTLAFVGASTQPDFTFRLVDAGGHTLPSAALDPATVAKTGSSVGNLQVSPDGRRYAVTGRSAGVGDIWLIDARTAETERVTFDAAEDEMAVWAPDGKRLAYTSAHTGSTRRIFVKSIESGTSPTLVATWPRHVHVSSWSPDGRWLALWDYGVETSTDVWAITVDGREKLAVANGAASETYPVFSPDGRWLAYMSNETGRYEVYVVSFPDLRSRRQVTTDGGTNPEWAPDGRALYYLQNGYLVAQEITLGGTFSRGRATRLFATTAAQFDLDVGHRFVLEEPARQAPEVPLHVILNWFQELRAKAPVSD